MEQKNYEIVKFVDNGFELEVNVSPSEDTVWLSVEQIADLFQRERSVISKHIGNLFRERELERRSVCAKHAHTAPDGKVYQVDYYNLDVIISVGYRVRSSRGIIFRKWAISILRQYMLRGYTVDPARTLVTNENYMNLVNVVNRIDSTQSELITRITGKELQPFNAQYRNLTIEYTDKVHDRFLVLDGNEMYHIGASLKDAGRKLFAMDLISNPEVIRFILEHAT